MCVYVYLFVYDMCDMCVWCVCVWCVCCMCFGGVCLVCVCVCMCVCVADNGEVDVSKCHYWQLFSEGPGNLFAPTGFNAFQCDERRYAQRSQPCFTLPMEPPMSHVEFKNSQCPLSLSMHYPWRF